MEKLSRKLMMHRIFHKETWMIDARTLGARPTGVGMYAFREIRRLLSNTNAPLKIILVCDVKSSVEIETLEAAGCEVRTYGKRVYNSIGVIGYFRFVKRMVRESKPDVFWQPNNLQPFWVEGVGRVAVTIHDVFGLGWDWRYALWHLYYRWNFRRTLENATEIWYNSEQTKREVHDRVDRGGYWPRRNAERVERVTHPIAEVSDRASVKAYRHERPYFLYLGNVETRKGADLLFAAYAEAQRDSMRSTRPNPIPDLLVAGNVRNIRVPSDPHVFHCGYVDDQTKWSLLKGCEALIVPSRAEGYGMQLAEALLFGTRVIASDLPVFKEVEDEVKTGAREGYGCPTDGHPIYLNGFIEGDDSTRISLLKQSMIKL